MVQVFRLYLELALLRLRQRALVSFRLLFCIVTACMKLMNIWTIFAVLLSSFLSSSFIFWWMIMTSTDLTLKDNVPVVVVDGS